MKKKICLFTAHSPQTGGGGAILRSLLPNLPEFEIVWCYIGPKPVTGYEDGYLGEGIMGGPILKDMLQTWRMLNGAAIVKLDAIVKKLIALNCDAYWMVSHNEGLRLAVDLVKQQNRPVHLTVHDDWAGALCARSFRYKWMKGPAQRLTIEALQIVPTTDVISDGMRSYYQELSGVDTDICHRFLAADSIQPVAYGQTTDDVITAGHIGSVYHKKDFLRFVEAFKAYAAKQNKKALLKMWGCHLNLGDIPKALRANIQFFPTLPEADALPELSKCAFVYAMYPFGSGLSVFAATSLPTKLTSYLQAGRPIFGHGPRKSTLTTFLNITGTGTAWTCNNINIGMERIAQVCKVDFKPETWQAARGAYFGEDNISVMRKCLN